MTAIWHFDAGEQGPSTPSLHTGKSRQTALIESVILPLPEERKLHGGASFLPAYIERVMGLALEVGAGIAFLHSHPVPGWQNMSGPDVEAETRLASRVFATTDLPLVGLTVGTDGAWSARFWPRVGRGSFTGHWCGTVRVVGDDFRVTYMEQLAPTPEFREELTRTVSAWGEAKQADLSRLRCGIVGVGSIGALVAEALVRMGVEDIVLIDFDDVKRHNLDRLHFATVHDIGRKKVEVAAEVLASHGTADPLRITPAPLSITDEDGFRMALDCDVLFSCVDRPWSRQVLNMIAYAHLIPVVDGGISVRVTPSGNMRGADWKAHIATPGRPCLECLEQFDPAHVTMERQGLLDNSTYIEGLPSDHFIHANQNVFAFAMHAASMMVGQFLSMVIKPGGISDIGPQSYHFATGTLDKLEIEGCLYPSLTANGD